MIVVKGRSAAGDANGGEGIGLERGRGLVAGRVSPRAKGVDVGAVVRVRGVDLPRTLLTRPLVHSKSGEIIGKTVHTGGPDDEIIVWRWRQQFGRDRRGWLVGIKGRRVEGRMAQEMNRTAPVVQARRCRL